MRMFTYAVFTRSQSYSNDRTWLLVAMIDSREYAQRFVLMLNKSFGHIQEYVYRELCKPISMNIEVEDLKTL